MGSQNLEILESLQIIIESEEIHSVAKVH